MLLRESSEPRVVPAPALVEVDYFVPPQAFARLLQDVETGAFLIEELRVADYARVAQLLAEYADLRVGFVDAAVLAIVERLGEPRLATLDHRHFSVMRPAHLETLELVPGR